MNKYIILIISIALLSFVACSEDSPLEPSDDLIVVRGYIYSGEPVNDIQITTTLPLGSEETSAPPVNDAEVSLIKAGVSYALVPSDGDSGYYHYTGDDLAVGPEEEFEIRVEYNGEIVTGKTVVPFPPEDVTLSSDVLSVPEEIGFGPMPEDSTSGVTITWSEDEESLFYVVIECVEENPEEIPTPFQGQSDDGRIKMRFVVPPTNNNEYFVRRFSLTYYGEHVVKVYRVNQEYADLYESRTQDSRDLNEPLTNIENGLGIFSAFASDAVSFTVVPE